VRRTALCLLIFSGACGDTGGSGGAADAGVDAGSDPIVDADVRDSSHAPDSPDAPNQPDAGPDSPDPCQGAETQGHTVGLRVCEPGVEPGYVLFAPNGSNRTWLIDRAGRTVHSWRHAARPALSVYLLEDGRLLRTVNTGMGPFQAGGAGGGLEIVEWDGQVSWSWRFVSDAGRLHHDVAPMPDGSILVLAWELKSGQEAVDAGRDPRTIPEEGEMWAEQLLQVQPRGDRDVDVLWEWHVWDHLVQGTDPDKPNFGVPADHPDRVDVNFAGRTADWLHINSVQYREDLDQAVLSVHNFSEIWVVDRADGELVYRWGNPQAYGREGEQRLFVQHDARWIPEGRPGAGNFMAFNNGGRSRSFSTVEEWTPPLLPDGSYALGEGAFGPEASAWSYAADGFYSSNISGAERLPGGNTLVCEGATGRFFEVTPAGELIWEYRNPDYGTDITLQGEEPPPSRMGNGYATATFRARHVPLDHPGLGGRDLVPGARVER
jgi:hypothetical protein